MTRSLLGANGHQAGTCPWMLETEVEANMSRKLFCRSLFQILIWLQVFIVACVVQYDVTGNAWLISAHGMLLVLVASASFVAGVPFHVDAILLEFIFFFAIIWSVLTWT